MEPEHQQQRLVCTAGLIATTSRAPDREGVSNGMDAPTRNGIRVPQWKCHQPLNRKGRPP